MRLVRTHRENGKDKAAELVGLLGRCNSKTQIMWLCAFTNVSVNKLIECVCDPHDWVFF